METLRKRSVFKKNLRYIRTRLNTSDIAPEHRDPESTLRGSGTASVRGDAKGYDGFSTDRPARSVTDSRMLSCLPHFQLGYSIRVCYSQSTVHPTIISRHFWPKLESSDIVMPGQFQQWVNRL
jgi:hypothetical protein